MKKLPTYLLLLIMTGVLSGCGNAFFCGMTFGQDERACHGLEGNPFQ